MQILLANAKIMFPTEKVKGKPLSEPMFQTTGNMLAEEMARMNTDELAKQLDCSQKIAIENRIRYQNFPHVKPVPAIMAYNGQAYKHLRAESLSPKAIEYGQNHLWITCFLYGLLRPMDGIVPYRMEHCVTLEATHDKPVNQFWKDKLTDVLIDSVKADDGILVHLSTEEYEHLFDWNRVTKEVKVIHPLFYVKKNDEMKVQAVWAKSCRGAMVRFMLQQQISHSDGLKAFEHEGFIYHPTSGNDDFPHFVRKQ
ncbi:MAG: YaaA family protein [Bacteroidales bacterium]|nr:YaaA family protein [Bacteroidales bacterium]